MRTASTGPGSTGPGSTGPGSTGPRSTARGINKAWRQLDDETIAGLPAQLGVYEIADSNGAVLCIGFAGGRHPFGLRTALEQEMQRLGAAAAQPAAAQFRFELTSNYRSRWNELLMVYMAQFGELPAGQGERPNQIGRLDLA